jgi:hypothetical protein
MVRIFTICALLQIVLVWSNQGKRDRRGMEHGWERCAKHIKLQLETQKGRDHLSGLGVVGDNIKINRREIGYEGVDWIYLAWEDGVWRAVLKTVMNLRVPCRAENFVTS